MASVLNRGTRDRPLWYAKIKDRDGRWRMVSTQQRTKAQALRWALEKQAEIANGAVGIATPEEKTFDDAADYWLKTHSEASCDSHDDNVGRMKHLREAFGAMLLRQITVQLIAEFRAAKKAATKDDGKGNAVPRWAPGTINRMLALLRKMLNDCAAWGWIKAAPKVKLLPVAEQDFDYLQRDEIERLLSWTSEHADQEFPLYAAAIYTGTRMGELYGLQWSEVSLDVGRATIQRSYDREYTKSKRIRRIPINRQLSIILREWKKRCPSELLVFPKPDGAMRARERPPADFGDHLAAARCHAIRFHDLRHTAASHMVMAGMNLRTVQNILGHSTIQVTERYAHLAPDFMSTDVDRLSLDIERWGRIRVLDGGTSQG
jgi:integrase